MSEAILANEIFHDEEKAVEYLESVRWPSGPVCPHCGGNDKVYRIKQNKEKKIRPGLLKCGLCQKQFTVKVGTLFESSHIPLYKWLWATHLIISSKKGISSHQLHRMLGITYKSAWFMTHRIREALKDPEFTNKLGGNGVEVRGIEPLSGWMESPHWLLRPPHRADRLICPNFCVDISDRLWQSIYYKGELIRLRKRTAMKIRTTYVDEPPAP